MSSNNNSSDALLPQIHSLDQFALPLELKSLFLKHSKTDQTESKREICILGDDVSLHHIESLLRTFLRASLHVQDKLSDLQHSRNCFTIAYCDDRFKTSKNNQTMSY